MGTMKTVLIQNPGDIRVVEQDIPTPQKGEALLKIKYCGICGSDVATYTGNQPFASYPRIPGHEFSAEIVEIFGVHTHLKPGMLVTANPYFNCNDCYPCKKGRTNCCENNQTMGVQRDGSFSEYITMPIERIVEAKGLSAKTLALVEPFSIGYHAIKRSAPSAGERVLVMGAGPIGIFSAIAAKIHGAHVYLADVLEKRLEFAKTFSINGIIHCKKENLSEQVQKITNRSGMDICVEAAGTPKTFLDCIEQICFGGKVILIGNTKKVTTFNHSILLKKELSVFGSRNSLNDFEPLIQRLIGGEVSIDSMISDIYDVSDTKQAFDALINNDGSMAKVLVKF